MTHLTFVLYQACKCNFSNLHSELALKISSALIVTAYATIVSISFVGNSKVETHAKQVAYLAVLSALSCGHAYIQSFGQFLAIK